MKYRAFGIEMRHVAVDVEADSATGAAKKAYQLFKKGRCGEGYSDEPWYDEDIEVAPYGDDDYDLAKSLILSGLPLGGERIMPRVLNKGTDVIPPDAVYVDRPSKWGNPFKFPTQFCPTREDCINAYRLHITAGEGKNLPLDELRGKDLVCWCAPLPCHADVLLELAN